VAIIPLSDIVEFMSNEKSFADSQDTTQTGDGKKKSSNGFKDPRAESYKKRKSFNDRRSHQEQQKGKPADGLRSDSECPIHGEHPWNRCFDNPSGTNYKPKGPDGCRPYTAGRGRGYGGYSSPGQG
jgi:hypothetical protein